VLEGQTTEVRFFEPAATWDFRCHFVMGDGSRSQFLSATGMGATRKVRNVTTRAPLFRVQLVPKEARPASFSTPDWEELDNQNQIVVRDVHPGKYRVVIDDWLMSRGFVEPLSERDLEITPHHSALTVPLGAGSITGAVQWSKQYRHMIHVIGVGKRSRAVRHARCDDKGNFCVRYLPPDDYVLFAHDDDAGWCRLGEASVANNTSDIGIHKLAPGAAITGRLPLHLATDRSVSIVAIDLHGIAIESPNRDVDGPPRTGFTISGLWPGKWLVMLKKNDQVLATKAVVLRDAESVSCDLMQK
jgi:hypothetical protein